MEALEAVLPAILRSGSHFWPKVADSQFIFKWLGDNFKWLTDSFKWLADSFKWLTESYKWLEDNFKWLAKT